MAVGIGSPTSQHNNPRSKMLDPRIDPRIMCLGTGEPSQNLRQAKTEERLSDLGVMRLGIETGSSLPIAVPRTPGSDKRTRRRKGIHDDAIFRYLCSRMTRFGCSPTHDLIAARVGCTNQNVKRAIPRLVRDHELQVKPYPGMQSLYYVAPELRK